MTPEQTIQFNELVEFMNNMKASTRIPFDVDAAITARLQSKGFAQIKSSVVRGLNTAPLTAIAPPAGGATVDSQARTAIGLIITDLQSLALTS